MCYIYLCKRDANSSMSNNSTKRL
uniref:Uncharacterized protein n=1 Tax=Rhizophora mucronata TaxID=61149 RepID=A0A2P2NI87_RHIMU